MYRKIVVGYDGSEQGRDALALAVALRASGGSVIAACVYPKGGPGGAEHFDPSVADAARRTLTGAREQADADWVELRAVAGHSPAHGLHLLCEEAAADLAVVGSSRSGDVGRVSPGSVGERLLNGSPCPIGLAPNGYRAKAGAPRVVGVAYDGSDEAAAALRAGAALASELGAGLTIVTVVPPLEAFASGVLSHPREGDEEIKAYRREEFRRMLENAAEPLAATLRTTTVLVEGRPADGIVEQAHQGMELLVMGSRSYGPIRRVMRGSTAIEVMRLAPCPVIVIPREAATPGAGGAAATAATAS
jgi:nucleotide-binding universal stress UspA family protein